MKINEILAELEIKVYQTLSDKNGNHVIQKCFEVINDEKLQFIIDTTVKYARDLAFDPFGCRVIQKMLDKIPLQKVKFLCFISFKECSYT